MAAQTAATEEPEPVPIVDGVPSQVEFMQRLEASPASPRSFKATWEERGSERRPARLAWRVRAEADEITWERFNMGAPSHETERFARTPAPGAQGMGGAPVWLLWLIGADRRRLVERLELDGESRALDVVDRRVLWVLGSTAGRYDRPQIRLDRETGRAQRVVERRGANESSQLLDVGFSLEPNEGPTPWLPKRLQVRDGERSVQLHLVSSERLESPGPAPTSATP